MYEEKKIAKQNKAEKKYKKSKKVNKNKKLTKAQLKEQKKLKLPKVERPKEEIKNLTAKFNRAIGQLNGIKKMIDEGRICEDILIQLSAVSSAIETIKFTLFKELFKKITNADSLENQIYINEILSTIKKY